MNNLVYPKYKAWKANGTAPATGYYLYTYDTDSTTQKATYADAERTTPNANPVVLDSAGEATIYLGPGSYRLDLKTPLGVLVNTFDPVTGDADTEVFSFTAIGGGLTTAPVITVKATRVGNIVSLIIPFFEGTSNAVTLSLTGLPVNLRPITPQCIQGIDVTDNAIVYPGQANISDSPTISFARKASFNAPSLEAFTASGDKGLANGVSASFTVTYSLQ